MKTITTLIMLLAFILSLQAAEPDFKVLGCKGKVTVNRSGEKKWTSLKTGDALYTSDKIQLKGGAYLGLAHKSGKTVEITKVGTYTISKLSGEVTARKSETSKKLANYVYDEISNTGNLLASDDYKQNMGTVGATERATGDKVNTEKDVAGMTGSSESGLKGLNFAVDNIFGGSEDMLEIRFPKTSYVIDDKLTFSWYKKPKVKEYELYISDRNNKKLYSTKTGDTTITLDLNSINLAKGMNYYWHLASGDDYRSDEYCIYRLNADEGKNILQTVKTLESDIGSNPTAMDMLILAAYYEDENIMNRAVAAYEEAIRLSPDIEDYRNVYARYLIRLGMNKEAKKIAGK